MECELQRCGGNGTRVVRRPWTARVVVAVSGPRWRGFKNRSYTVCEHCAGLLINEARVHGLRYTKKSVGPDPESGELKRGASAEPADDRKRPRAARPPRMLYPKPILTLDDAMEEQRARDLARVEEIQAMRRAQQRQKHRRR